MTERWQCANESHDADLIAACDAAIALVQQTNTDANCDGMIDRISDEITRLVDQIVSMRATTLAGFKARARALLTIYPAIAGEGEAIGNSAMIASLVRDLIAVR